MHFENTQNSLENTLRPGENNNLQNIVTEIESHFKKSAIESYSPLDLEIIKKSPFEVVEK